MEYTIENMDYRCKLLYGEHIEFENNKIYPLTLKEIKDFSFEKYNKFLSLTSFTKNEIMEMLKTVEEISLYDFILISVVSDKSEELLKLMLGFLTLILKEEVMFSQDGCYITDSGFKLNHENFHTFINIIRDQNGIKEREDKILTKKERDYKEMVREAREKHKEYIKHIGNANDTDLLDLISALSSKHPSLNLLNIWELTVYQLIDQFKRLNMIDDYSVGIDSLLAGASKKDVQLIHWSKKFID